MEAITDIKQIVGLILKAENRLEDLTQSESRQLLEIFAGAISRHLQLSNEIVQAELDDPSGPHPLIDSKERYTATDVISIMYQLLYGPLGMKAVIERLSGGQLKH